LHLKKFPFKFNNLSNWFSTISKYTFFFNWFPFDNFRYYFTLFSKFFSSFPQGTSSLSVSNPYLALDGVYHQICAVLSNNTTRWKRKSIDKHEKQMQIKQDFHLLWLFSFFLFSNKIFAYFSWSILNFFSLKNYNSEFFFWF